jgi:nicotinate-nucleotide adenylyltransferase
MLKVAIEPYPELIVDDRELRRQGPSWTIDTLTELRTQFPARPLVLALGADSLANLHHWHRWQDYSALCHLAVLPRPGAADPADEVLSAFPKTDAASLLRQPAGRRLMLSAPFLDVSSSAVRRLLAEKSHCPALDEAVLAHIHRHGLYTGAVDVRPDNEDS